MGDFDLNVDSLIQRLLESKYNEIENNIHFELKSFIFPVFPPHSTTPPPVLIYNLILPVCVSE